MMALRLLPALCLFSLSFAPIQGCPYFAQTSAIVEQINAFRAEVSDGKHPHLPKPKRPLLPITATTSAELHPTRSIGCASKFPPDYYKLGGQEMHIFDLTAEENCHFNQSITRFIAESANPPSFDFMTNSCHKDKRHSCNMVAAMLKDFSEIDGPHEGWEMHCNGRLCHWGTRNYGRLLFCKLTPVHYLQKELTDEFLARPYAIDGATNNTYPSGYVERRPESEFHEEHMFSSTTSQNRVPLTLVMLGVIPCLAAVAGCYYRLKSPIRKETRYSTIHS